MASRIPPECPLKWPRGRPQRTSASGGGSAPYGQKWTGGGKTHADVRKVFYNSMVFCLKFRIFKAKFAFLVNFSFTKEELNSDDFSLFSAAQLDEISEQCILRASAIALPDDICNTCSSCMDLMLDADVRRGGVGPMRTEADRGGEGQKHGFLADALYRRPPIA